MCHQTWLRLGVKFRVRSMHIDCPCIPSGTALSEDSAQESLASRTLLVQTSVYRYVINLLGPSLKRMSCLYAENPRHGIQPCQPTSEQWLVDPYRVCWFYLEGQILVSLSFVTQIHKEGQVSLL